MNSIILLLPTPALLNCDSRSVPAVSESLVKSGLSPALLKLRLSELSLLPATKKKGFGGVKEASFGEGLSERSAVSTVSSSLLDECAVEGNLGWDESSDGGGGEVSSGMKVAPVFPGLLSER